MALALVPPGPVEEQCTIHVSRSVIERFQASVTGWETSIDQALRQGLDDHQAS